MNATAETGTPTARPQIRSITTEDVYAALSQGWADFKAAPKYGLFFGGVYAIAGILIWLQLLVWDRPYWILPLALAFPLIGPFVAVGLYEVSRRREAGEPLDWSQVLDVVWKQRSGQLPSMAFVVMAGFMIWVWVARLLVALFLGRMSSATYSDFGALLSTGNGLTMVLVGSVIGGIIAFILFSISAVSLPMLLERDVDFVTAMVTSFNAVTTNLVPMLTWAAIIAVGLFVGMVPFFLGLIIVLPVLGHATWHIYRKVIVREGETA
jgi:uncharacterized membrane protein